jgi:hypothetical protein
MTSSKASRAGKRAVVTHIALTVIFTAIFGGITLIAFFLSKLNF